MSLLIEQHQSRNLAIDTLDVSLPPFETGNQELDTWTTERSALAQAGLESRADDNLMKQYRKAGLPDSSALATMNRDIVIQRLAEYKAVQARNTMLLEIGSKTYTDAGVGIDLLVGTVLPSARTAVTGYDASTRDSKAGQMLDNNEHKLKYTNSPDTVKEEMLAHAIAKQAVENHIIVQTAQRITDSDIAAYEEAKIQENKPTEKIASATQFGSSAKEKQITYGEVAGSTVETFTNATEAAVDVDDWVNLPISPLLIPVTAKVDKEKLQNPRELATFIWDNILYSPQFVDRNGAEVAMDSEARAAHISKVQSFIEAGVPIHCSEYTPVIAIPNPLKRHTQEPALADIDFMRRLLEVNKAVELFYENGLQWEIINEVPAPPFIEMFNLDPAYVDRFHYQVADVIDRLNENYGRKVINFTRMDDYLTGDSEKSAAWEQYRTQKTAEMQGILDNPSHPKHDEWTNKIAMFTYPMATCANPYDFQVTHGMSVSEVVQVYETLKAQTGSKMRGVGMGKGRDNGFTPAQTELLGLLDQKGRHLAFTYQMTMGARESLSSFDEINQTLKYTMVTKLNKPVLFPNSGRGPSFPAHGEAVFIAGSNGQRSTVTVKPWVDILAQRDRFATVPHISKTTGEPLYFQPNNQ